MKYSVRDFLSDPVVKTTFFQFTGCGSISGQGNNIPYAITAAAAAAKSLQSCLTLCDPIEGSPPGSPSLGFSRQEHWSGLPLPSPMHESEKIGFSQKIANK